MQAKTKRIYFVKLEKFLVDVISDLIPFARDRGLAMMGSEIDRLENEAMELMEYIRDTGLESYGRHRHRGPTCGETVMAGRPGAPLVRRDGREDDETMIS